jgi:hypothetical protein
MIVHMLRVDYEDLQDDIANKKMTLDAPFYSEEEFSEAEEEQYVKVEIRRIE